MSLFKNIESYFPKNGNETEKYILQSYRKNGPNFISLKNDITIKNKF
jgi:hypothetical protein